MLDSCSGFSSFASNLPAQEWNRFRGPNGRGLARPHSPCNGPRKITYGRRRSQAAGIPARSPGRIMFTSPPRKTRRASTSSCASTPKTARRSGSDFADASYKMHARNSIATSTPCVDKDRLYLTWATPAHLIVQALDRKTGKDVWQIDLGKYVSQHGFGPPPSFTKICLSCPTNKTKKAGCTPWTRRPARKSGSCRATPATQPIPLRASTKCRAAPPRSSSPTGSTASPPWSRAPARSNGKSLASSRRRRNAPSPARSSPAIWSSAPAASSPPRSTSSPCGPPTTASAGSVAHRKSGRLHADADRQGQPHLHVQRTGRHELHRYGEWQSDLAGTARQQILQLPDLCRHRVLHRRRRRSFVVEAADAFKLLGRSFAGSTQSTPAITAGVMVFLTAERLIGLGAAK